MLRAVCVNCGAAKHCPLDKCRKCRFDPRVDEAAVVESIYLSLDRLDQDADEEQYRACEDELRRAARTIRHGGQVEYDPHELQRLRELKQALESVRLRHVLWILYIVFRPAIVFLAILWLILYLLETFFPPR